MLSPHNFHGCLRQLDPEIRHIHDEALRLKMTRPESLTAFELQIVEDVCRVFRENCDAAYLDGYFTDQKLERKA